MDNVLQVIDALTKAIRSAATHNPNVQVPPACILWPDGDRQFEPVIARLLGELPELCVLGDYAPEIRTGPAIWLRMVIADKADDTKLPPDTTPILYLPGVRRQDLRAVEACPERLKPLAELQYRGAIWSQVNAKDWTIAAFLHSGQGGLGLDVATDRETKQAMRLALFRLLDERIDLLDGKRLDRDYFNTLLTSGDPIRDLLQWIDSPAAIREACDANQWNAFAAILKSQFRFDPVSDGELEAAARLAERAPPWDSVWQRFADSPHRFPNIPAQIRKQPMPEVNDLFADRGGWPQWNDDQESELRSALMSLTGQTPESARKTLIELEKQHAGRRAEVWTELGMSPLAVALEHLAALAPITADSLAAGSAADMAAAYRASGWRADDHMLHALAAVRTEPDLAAVESALRAIYLPWATDAAMHLQKVVAADGYPRQSIRQASPPDFHAGTCLLFIDGLRLDLAKRLEAELERAGLQVAATYDWAALPSVTSTAKPAVSPVAELITGQEANQDFTPMATASGKSLRGGYEFQKLLESQGWQRLGKTETGDPQGLAWCEIGDIDHEGHDRGWKLARHVDSLLQEAIERVEQLVAAGWADIRIVTDHGWLLMPGGLPDTQLAPSLAVNKWGRCAAIKTGAATDVRLYHWYWNPTQCFALAHGICCFQRGKQYAHGGLSLQECVTMGLTVRGSGVRPGSVRITEVKWRRLRCTLTINQPAPGLRLDIRTHAGNPETSEVVQVKPFGDKPTATVIVADEDLDGSVCWLVVLDAADNIVIQQQTTVGGGAD